MGSEEQAGCLPHKENLTMRGFTFFLKPFPLTLFSADDCALFVNILAEHEARQSRVTSPKLREWLQGCCFWGDLNTHVFPIKILLSQPFWNWRIGRRQERLGFKERGACWKEHTASLYPVLIPVGWSVTGQHPRCNFTTFWWQMSMTALRWCPTLPPHPYSA